MKTPLRYQVTRHDCGPTSMVNALMYLFEREEIHPELLQYITAVTIDRDHGKGAAPGGTSGHALDFLAWWLNDYAKTMGFPLRCEALPEDQISMREGFALRKAVEAGAVVVTGCRLGADHYVLITGMEGDKVMLFDPYYDVWPLTNLPAPAVGVELVSDRPFECNRAVETWVFDEPAPTPYSLDTRSKRDAILFFHTACGHRPCEDVAQ